MNKTLAELAELVDGEVVGNPGLVIACATSAAGGGPDTITFAENTLALEAALASPVGAVVAVVDAQGDKPMIRTASPRGAFVRIAAALHPEVRPPAGLHPTAVVVDGAHLGAQVHVGPHAVVEAGARVGDRTVVGAGCFVGAGVSLGEDCRLHPHVSLYAGVTVGHRVILHSGVVIGIDGFGYIDTPAGKEKFPQLGSVIIEDDVEIGANTTVDRAALDVTVIREGAKIDNLVQIAHNVEIGRHCALSSQVGVAGTSKLGEWVVLAGQVGVADHVSIGDRAVVGAQSGVPTKKKLPGAAAYLGSPARPLRDAKRIYGEVARIGKLSDKVSDLVKRVEELEDRGD